MVEVAYEEPKDIDDIPLPKHKDLKAKRSGDAAALGLIQRGVEMDLQGKT